MAHTRKSLVEIGESSRTTRFASERGEFSFRNFVHYIVDEMYLLPKLRVVDAIKKVPSDVRANIDRINALRNALAHSLFPENRRQYKEYHKVIYRGTDIFSKAGIEKFEDDFDVAHQYILKRARG